MAYRAHIITSWVQIGQRNHMKVAVDHPWPGVAYTDITWQPDANLLPDPNAFIVEVAPLSAAELAALNADAACIVLWNEEIV